MKNSVKISDEELIKTILQNDANALGELYNRYYKKVFQKCLSIVKDHDEAFDLAQDALMTAFDNLKSFRGESSFSTWLYVITHRHCLQALRKSKKSIATHDYVLDQVAKDFVEFGDEPGGQHDLENIMISLINKLPINEKELVLLKYSKGESIESLQSRFHLSASAVKMRLKRSKEKLNQLYNIALTVGLADALSQLG